MHIDLIKGKFRYYWVLRAANGEIVASSQRYSTKWSARRTAKALARANGWEYREV